MRNTLHIEFYGIPGCGKTTIANLVSRKLESQGYILVIPDKRLKYDRNPFYRKIMKLFTTIKYSLTHPVTLLKIICLTKKNGYKKINNQITHIVNIIPKIYIYNSTPANKIVVWDEGITQSSVSLSVNSLVSVKENENAIIDLIDKNIIQIHVYLVVEMKIALERMDKRATNDSRVEKEHNKEKQLAFLQKFEDVCNSYDKDIVINVGDKSVEEIANEVLSKLIEKIKMVENNISLC